MRATTTRRPTGFTRHGRVACLCAGVAVGMVGVAYAAVPLYRLFCQATGFAGTTMKATRPADRVLDKTIAIRFDRNIGSGLAWTVEPVVNTMRVRIGETSLAFYRATNTSDRPITGTATFNVTPDQAGIFFNKLECFCFKEQTLGPGETVDMPVSFFVDPAIVDDRDGRTIDLITLSYTFYPVETAKAGVAEKPAGAAARRGS